MSTQTADGYAWIAQIRTQLVGYVTDTEAVAQDISDFALLAKLADLRERISSDDFMVLVAGEFKTGKSTTINAILGNKILPADVIPTTAVLSVVHWADTPTAHLYRPDPNNTNGLATDAVPIDIGDLKDHIVIDDLKPDELNPWGKADIGWPLALCRNGVSVVDSPGLNEHPERSKITMGYLGRADAIVFVMDAIRAMSVSERNFLNLHVKAQGHDDVFFVCNRINQLESPEDQEKVRNRVRRVLMEDWATLDNRIFFVNAKAALDGRLNGDAAMVSGSGIPEFEKHLEAFLSTERARLKVIPPAHQLQQLVSEARALIDYKRDLLDRDVEELRATKERAEIPLQHLESERRLINKLIEQHLAETRSEVENAARAAMVIAADSCPQWAQEIDRQHKISPNPITVQKQVNAATTEISEALSARLQEYFAVWEREKLRPLVAERVEAMERDVDGSLKSFFEHLDAVRLSFVPATVPETEADRQPSAGQRAFAVGIGVLLLDPGSAVVGARFGLVPMLKTFLPQIGLAVAGVLLGFTPAGIMAFLFGSGVLRTLWKANKADTQIVAKITASVADEIRRTTTDQSRKIGAEVLKNLDTIRVAIDASLGGQLVSVREAVDVAISDLEQGSDHARQIKDQLAACLKTLTSVEDGVVDIMVEFAR